MTRKSVIFAAFALLFAFNLTLLAVAETNGFISKRMMELWAAGITQVEATGFRQTESFYPPLPDTLNLIATWLIPGQVPAPLVLSAILASLLTMLWFANLRQNGGFGWIGAGILTTLLVLNPMFLRSFAEGPGMVLMLFGTWLYLRGLVNLRIRGSAPDIMKVGLGLVIAVVSHGYGLMIAAAALPCLMMSGRPDQLTNAPFGFLATMVFPVALAGVSLIFVGYVFDLPIFTPQPGSGSVTAPRAVMVAILALLPASITAILLHSGLMRFWLPLVAGLATLLAATVMNVMLGLLTDPILIAAPYLCFAAVAIRFWPFTQRRGPIAAAMLTVSWVCCAILVTLPSNAVTSRWALAVLGHQVDNSERQAAAQVVNFLDGKTGVMVDIERSPELVIASNGVQGLTVAGQPRYDLAVRTRQSDADILVLRTAALNTNAERDRLARALGLTGFGVPPGYIVTFSAGPWQVYESIEQ